MSCSCNAIPREFTCNKVTIKPRIFTFAELSKTKWYSMATGKLVKFKFVKRNKKRKPRKLKKAIKKYKPKYYFGYIDINDNYNLISEF